MDFWVHYLPIKDFFLHAPPTVICFLLGIFGVCMGSFLNVVIYRIPAMIEQCWRDEHDQYHQIYCLNATTFDRAEQATSTPRLSLSFPASHCPTCKHSLATLDNLPIVSWLWLNGRCRYCQASISWQYPSIEIITCIFTLILWFTFSWSWQFVASLWLVYSLICLIVIDFKHYLLPDRLVFPLMAMGLAVNSNGLFTSASSSIWGCIVGFGFFYVVYLCYKWWRKKEAMGYGDFKLSAALGAWFGIEQLFLMIALASILGIIIGCGYLLVRKHSSAFPFGPALALSGIIVLLLQTKLQTIFYSFLI